MRADWVSHKVRRPRAAAGSQGSQQGKWQEGGRRAAGTPGWPWWRRCCSRRDPSHQPCQHWWLQRVPLRAHLARRDTGRGTGAVTVSEGITVSYLHLQGGQRDGGWAGRGRAGCFYLLTCLVIHMQSLLPPGHLFPPAQSGFWLLNNRELLWSKTLSVSAKLPLRASVFKSQLLKVIDNLLSQFEVTYCFLVSGLKVFGFF